MPSIDFGRFQSLKGEFEAEGLTVEELAGEALFASRHGLDYLVKIGGCEARSDIDVLRRLGITSVVVPMIESAFAMEKYMGVLPAGAFNKIGVTIETIDAVERIEQILDAGTSLTHVTIGRNDLTASFRGSGSNSPETLEKTRIVARAAKKRGLVVGMGGGIDGDARRLLRDGDELAGLIDQIETRKVVMALDQFLLDGALEDSIRLELALLEMRARPLNAALAEITARSGKISNRL